MRPRRASLRKASLRALSAAAFWRLLPWPSSRRRPSRRRPFQPRLSAAAFSAAAFRRRPSCGVFLGLLLGGDLFGCGLFRSGLLGGSLVSGLAFLLQALFPSARPACALPPGAPFLAASAASRAFSSSSRFFLACSAISGSTSDLGGWTLGSGGGGEDPAASAARVPVAAWAEAGVWAVRAWAAAKRANCRSPRAALPPGRAFPCASSG